MEVDFLELYKTYSQDVLNVAFFYTKNQEDAQDVLMEVFYRLMNNPPKDDKNIKSYLLRDTMYRAMDFYRQKKRYIHAEEDLFTSKDVSESHQIDIDIIRSLPKKYLSVIVLHYYEEMNIKEISETLKSRIKS